MMLITVDQLGLSAVVHLVGVAAVVEKSWLLSVFEQLLISCYIIGVFMAIVDVLGIMAIINFLVVSGLVQVLWISCLRGPSWVGDYGLLIVTRELFAEAASGLLYEVLSRPGVILVPSLWIIGKHPLLFSFGEHILPLGVDMVAQTLKLIFGNGPSRLAFSLVERLCINGQLLHSPGHLRFRNHLCIPARIFVQILVSTVA
jgi:hypothetical protein